MGSAVVKSKDKANAALTLAQSKALAQMWG